MDIRITSTKLQKWFWEPFYAEAMIGVKRTNKSRVYWSRAFVLALPIPLNLEPYPMSRSLNTKNVEKLVNFFSSLYTARNIAVQYFCFNIFLLAIGASVLYFAPELTWELLPACVMVVVSIIGSYINLRRAINLAVIPFAECCRDSD